MPTLVYEGLKIVNAVFRRYLTLGSGLIVSVTSAVFKKGGPYFLSRL